MRCLRPQQLRGLRGTAYFRGTGLAGGLPVLAAWAVSCMLIEQVVSRRAGPRRPPRDKERTTLNARLGSRFKSADARWYVRGRVAARTHPLLAFCSRMPLSICLPTVKHVTVGPNGARLGYVEKAGQGRVVVFLHGLGASSPVYFGATAASSVMAGSRVLMIDFLGFGISDRPMDFSYTLEDHADSLARGLDELALTAVDIVAHSMGGSIAIVLAARRPDLVNRLVLAEPNLTPSARPRVEPFTEAEFVATGFAQALAAVGPDWAATMRLTDPIALYRTELSLGRGTSPMMDELMSALPVPYVLLEGEYTAGLADDPSIRALGIPVTIVPEAGHTMMLDNPVAFAAALAVALDLVP